jgi:hypothetical protein
MVSVSRLVSLLASLWAFTVFALFPPAAGAGLLVNTAVGGAPLGATYANFDNLSLGAAGGVSGGIAVSFTSDGQTVLGAAGGLYAAPYISNSSGAPFGDPTASGPDATRYLSTGIGSVTLLLPGAMQYFGLLWGSVDTYNRLEFFSGSSSVGFLTGLDVAASANGDQGINGTYYVNILSDLDFDRVVASSSSYAFEFDNVSFDETDPAAVTEPLSFALLGIGLFTIAAMRRRTWSWRAGRFNALPPFPRNRRKHIPCRNWPL